MTNIQQKVKQILQENNMYSPPIDVVRLAKNEGFIVELAEIDGDGIIINSNDEFTIGGGSKKYKKVILVNHQSSAGRQVFTIAHELAHWFLEAKESGEEFFGKRDDNLTYYRETEINNFASELLIPQELLKDYMNDNKDKSEYELIYLVADRFNVSREAAKVRLSKYWGVSVNELPY